MAEQSSKKPYQKPKLNRLGKLTQLTTGGSGAMAENFSMMMFGMMLMRFP